MQPHRGVKILILGILGLAGLSILTGVPAWIMGRNDLKSMEAGVMDAEGRSLTNTGRILGIISIVLFVGFVLFQLLLNNLKQLLYYFFA